ncbi:MAG: tetratricopeptide repeat protein [bacterium]|nr:tetratricopeptide repeat protein [bacterium]
MNKKILYLLTFLIIIAGCGFSAEMTDNIKKGISKMALNRLDDALTYFEREIASNPRNGLGYYYAGEVYYRKANFSKALELFQKAIEIEPNRAAYHLGTGIAYLALGQSDKAIEEFQTVINNAPGTYEAKQAEQNLAKIKGMKRDREIVEKWQNAEKNVQVEKVVEKKPETPQMQILAQTVSIDSLVKDLRFGQESKRKDASKMLYNFTSSQLEPFLPQFISHMEKEKNEEVKKNLLLVIGKTQTQQAVDYLFGVLENPEKPFDTKMVALAALSETLSPAAAEKLKDVLDKMVSAKIKKREDARARIESIEKRIDDLESQKFVLRNDITKLRTQRQSIYDKLNVQPAVEEGPGVGPVPAPGIAPPSPVPAQRQIEILTPEQIRQLRAQLRTIENDIHNKESRLSRLEKQVENLNAEKTKYEQLLVKRPTTGSVKVLGVTRATTVQPQQEIPPGMPPQMVPGVPQVQPSFTQAGSEEEQEQSLALSIIKILGRIGKPDYLPVIEKAWEEYKADSFELDYGLVRAQLGSYEYIDQLAARLQEDYPGSDQDEVYFRADIVKALGNYLATHENQDYAELIGYLAESDPNQVVKIAANQALSKIKSKEEKPARQT